jgi:hypothetical protein
MQLVAFKEPRSYTTDGFSKVVISQLATPVHSTCLSWSLRFFRTIKSARKIPFVIGRSFDQAIQPGSRTRAWQGVLARTSPFLHGIKIAYRVRQI